MNYIKTYITVATMMLGGLCCSVQAQTEKEDEVVVTNDNGEKEEIEVPEMMMQNLDSLLAQYHAKTYLKPDAECSYRDESPAYSADVYKERLQRLPTIFEMRYNDAVQKFIDRYTNRNNRSTVAVMLGASNFYMPIFEQALEAYDLPLELKYLPVIESALNPNAVSRVGAGGLWQFMLSTGKDYGLKVNTLVDERRDPDKASYAAAHYLSDLYHIFGDWNLVLAAYNAGPAVVNKAIHRAGGVKDYWKISPYLPKETRGYVPAFIAANYVMNYYCEHNICPMLTTLPVKTDTVMVNKDVRFEQVAQVLGLDAEALRAINPMYRRDIINGNTQPSPLRLPIDYINKFIDNQETIYNKKVEDESANADNGSGEVKKSESGDDSDRKSSRRSRRHKRNYDEDNNSSSKKDVKKDDSDSKSKKDSDDVSDSKSKKSKKDNDEANDSKSKKSKKSNDEDSDSKVKKSKKSRDNDSDDDSYKKKKGKKRHDSDSDSKSKKSSKKDKKSKKSKKESSSKEVTIKNGESLSVIAEKNHTTVSKLKKLNKISGDNIRAGKKLKVR